MKKEEWVPITGFENRYLISNRGRVKRIATGRILKKGPCLNKNGYSTVCLQDLKNGKGKKMFRTHKLVAEHFLPKRSPDQNVVIFMDGNPANVNPSNLRWANARERLTYRKKSNYVYRKNNRSGKIFYVVVITDNNGDRVHVGSYAKRKDAIAARGVAMRKHKIKNRIVNERLKNS